jgi:hypothetical protein
MVACEAVLEGFITAGDTYDGYMWCCESIVDAVRASDIRWRFSTIGFAVSYKEVQFEGGPS